MKILNGARVFGSTRPEWMFFVPAVCRCGSTPCVAAPRGVGGPRVMGLGAVLGLVLSLVAASAWAAEGETIGSIKTLQGQAAVVRTQQILPAEIGLKLMKTDVLKTGPNGSVGIILRDDTLLSLGPNSELLLADFVFAPAEGKLSLVTRLTQGTAAYLSGQIGKLAPHAVRFETPVATIGTRGTMFAVKIDAPRP